MTFAGNWLNSFLASSNVLSAFDLVLITFDENEADTGDNQVFTAIQGQAVTSVGAQDGTTLSHYSVLATLEGNFGLGNLGKNDVTTNAFTL